MTVRAVEFPRCISIDSAGGPVFKTTINETASGFEFRNVDWSRQRCEYDISMGIKTGADARQVRNLFYASYGRAYGFLYYDWNDHSIGEPGAPAVIDNSADVAQLVKRYQYGSYAYDRIITRPNIDLEDIEVYLDGELLTGGDYEIDPVTGAVTVPETGVVSVYMPEFWVPVRFDQDNLSEILKFIDRTMDDDEPVVDVPSIKLVEIKEEGYVAP